MITTVEGIYKRGKDELFEAPAGVQESRVLVTFLPKAITTPTPRQMIYGEFSGKQMSTEDDFHIAEWRGEAEDGD